MNTPSEQIGPETSELLIRLRLTEAKIIADRRGTLAISAKRKDYEFILKLHSVNDDLEAIEKSNLLQVEANMLKTIPQDLTKKLYEESGKYKDLNWLLLRQVGGIEVMNLARDVTKNGTSKDDKKNFLLDLLVTTAKFYSNLFSGGYLHGDVQPSHIFLENGEATVIDWGLSREVNKPNPLYRGGFVYFCSPEVARQMIVNKTNVTYGVEEEVYSLGSTLFMIYTDNLAIKFGVPVSELKDMPITLKLEKVIKNKINTFQELKINEYPELEEILIKSLSSSPSERYKNPSDLYSALVALKKQPTY